MFPALFCIDKREGVTLYYFFSFPFFFLITGHTVYCVVMTLKAFFSFISTAFVFSVWNVV